MSTPRYLRRDDVPAFLRDRFGITIAVSTLKDLRVTGDGPETEYFRGRPLYREDKLARIPQMDRCSVSLVHRFSLVGQDFMPDQVAES